MVTKKVEGYNYKREYVHATDLKFAEAKKIVNEMNAKKEWLTEYYLELY